MNITKNDLLFSLAIISAVWFTLTGMVWVYWIALVIAYPFGLVSYFLWKSLRKNGEKRNRAIPIILLVGLGLSLITLVLLLLFD